jgi:hypothetical protein
LNGKYYISERRSYNNTNTQVGISEILKI